ncbi:MAG: ATP-binding protein [Gaiellales bacterium]
MSRPAFDDAPPALGADMTETETRVAWLRLAAIPILAVGESLPHPDPQAQAFYIALGVFAGLAVAILVRVYRGPVGQRFSLATTTIDVVSLTTLALLSGGAFSPAHLALFLVPITVAFRFRPPLTALASGATLVAYLTQALLHPSVSGPDALHFIAVRASYLAWIGAAAVLLSAVLERRTRRVAQLASARRRLLADALSAEERERSALAEGLHDHAIQNLLSARHELDEASESQPHPALERADAAVAATIVDLRETISELHPFVLAEAGLEAAIGSAAQRAARQGGFGLTCNLRLPHRSPHERLLFSAARQLLANAVQHAGATAVTVDLLERDGNAILVVEDNGKGFDVASLPDRIAQGHIGLASQRERIEGVGGMFEIDSAPGSGTRILVRVPGGW